MDLSAHSEKIINSLDRWKNYADQFDPSWEALNI